jgi:type IX secretion system PorP/SprF family membrane protein
MIRAFIPLNPGKSRNFFIATASLIPMAAVAQHGTFSQHYSLYNPAATGLLNRQEANLTTTFQQYNKNTLTNYYANYNARVAKIHGALGVSYYRRQYNRASYDDLNLNYSYHIRLGENSTLAAGISVGRTSITAPSILSDPSKIYKGYAFNVGFGLSYTYKNFHAGVSVQRINEPKLSAELPFGPRRLTRMYSFYVDHTWEVSDRFKLQTSVLLRTGTPGYGSLNASLRGTFRNGLYVGISSTTYGGYGATVGYDFKNGFGIGYTYEQRPTGESKITNGLTLRFRVK